MFGLKYLSREKKVLLTKAQNRLINNSEPKARREAELVIQELLSDAKPYLECDVQEAGELRDQLLQQIMVLEGMGKHQSAESFRMHLRDVEFHIQTCQMERQTREEARPVRVTDPPNAPDQLPSMNGLAREKRKKKAMGRARWTIDMDEETKDDPETI